jgi:uncharacterized protein YcgI (DUF1989 family)
MLRGPGEARRRGMGGQMEERFVQVPAREGRAVNVGAGECFRVIDVEGGQVVDLFAFVAGDVDEYASAEHTRVAVDRLFPLVGQSFHTNRRRPILRFEEDRSPGVHDMLCAACDPTRYALLGATAPHASCQENLQRAMGDLGYGSVHTPQPINLFMDARVGPDGSLTLGPAPTRAGDHVVLRAELDCVVVASACPQDMNLINNGIPTPIAIELLKAPTPPSP